MRYKVKIFLIVKRLTTRSTAVKVAREIVFKMNLLQEERREGKKCMGKPKSRRYSQVTKGIIDFHLNDYLDNCRHKPFGLYEGHITENQKALLCAIVFFCILVGNGRKMERRRLRHAHG